MWEKAIEMLTHALQGWLQCYRQAMSKEIVVMHADWHLPLLLVNAIASALLLSEIRRSGCMGGKALSFVAREC